MRCLFVLFIVLAASTAHARGVPAHHPGSDHGGIPPECVKLWQGAPPAKGSDLARWNRHGCAGYYLEAQPQTLYPRSQPDYAWTAIDWSEGTRTRDMFVGLCYKEVFAQGFAGRADCEELWADVSGLIKGHKLCYTKEEIASKPFRDFLAKWNFLVNAAPNTRLFWDSARAKQVINMLVSAHGMQADGTTVLGSIFDQMPQLCGSDATASGFARSALDCYPREPCQAPLMSFQDFFWIDVSSGVWAQQAEGKIYVVLDTRDNQTVYDVEAQHPFAADEVPALGSGVTEMVVWPITRNKVFNGVRERCGSGSLAVLQKHMAELHPKIKFTCVDNPSIARHAYCFFSDYSARLSPSIAIWNDDWFSASFTGGFFDDSKSAPACRLAFPGNGIPSTTQGTPL